MSSRKFSEKEHLLKVSVKPSFLFIVSFILSFDSDFISFFSLAAAFIHEFSHIAVLYLLKTPSTLTLKLGGMSLKLGSPPRHEWVYLLSGPAANLLIFLIFRRSIFGAVNLLVGTVNLLPIYFTDGGRLLDIILSKFLYGRALFITESIISAIFLIPLFALGIFILFSAPYNFTLLTVAVYLITALISKEALD